MYNLKEKLHICITYIIVVFCIFRFNTNTHIMKYTAVILTLVMLPVIVQANKNYSLAEKCQNAFIGVEYDKSLEKECRPMWDKMTKEIKQSFNIWTVKSVEKLPKVIVTTSKIEKKNTVTRNVKIYRDGWNDPRVQYAYDISGGNMDFILTIEAESRWDPKAVWDHGNSFGLCQIHKKYNAEMQKQYRSLETDNEKVKLCFDQYKWWVNRGVIKTRLYGYNYRKARAYLFTMK